MDFCGMYSYAGRIAFAPRSMSAEAGRTKSKREGQNSEKKALPRQVSITLWEPSDWDGANFAFFVSFFRVVPVIVTASF